MIGTIAFAAALARLAGPGAVEVTVYNQGFGFVKEVRDLNLSSGAQSVRIEDVASSIEPTSVGIRSLTDPMAFEVLEQNYQYDLISPLAILNKSVGKRVRFIRTIGQQKDVLEGVLISSPTAVVGTPDGSQHTYNGMVIRTDDGRIVLSPMGEIEVTEVPEGLISKPTLLWNLNVAKPGANTIELSYITQGMNWNADYVLMLGGIGESANLRGWVTVNNASGATYRNAKLKLLAGDVQRAPAPRPYGRAGAGVMEMKAAAAPFQEESLFEYHLYTLQRPATIADREIKQLSLLEATGLKVTKKLIVDALMNYGMYYPSEGEIGSGIIKPQVRLEFVNSKENGLGIPLPKGKVKVYQRDASGSVQMLGEDAIEHTPKDEKLSLVVGRSFDIVAERKRLSFHVLTPRRWEETFQIELRNRKETADTVHVIERHWGDWRITDASDKWEKLDANAMQFVVELKAGEVRKVKYTVETTW